MCKFKSHSCLNCKFEPDWSEYSKGEYGTSSGECKFFIEEKEVLKLIPACVSSYISLRKRKIRRYKDGSGIHYNCGTYKAKEN
jgi:hypothetical protein